MKPKIMGLLAVGLLAGPMAANAISISDPGFNSTVGTLEVGSNTVSGTFTQRCDDRIGCTGSDVRFFADLAVGTTLTSISLLLEGYTGPGGLLLIARNDNPDYTTSVGTGTANLFSGFLAGPENLGLIRLYGDSPTVGTHSIKYLYTFEVINSAVPEPGTLALLVLGLAGLGLSRRRNAH